MSIRIPINKARHRIDPDSYLKPVPLRICRFCHMRDTGYLTCTSCSLSACSNCVFTSTKTHMYELNDKFYCRSCYKIKKDLNTIKKSNE